MKRSIAVILALVMFASVASASMLYKNVPLGQEEYYAGGEGKLTLQYSQRMSGMDGTRLSLVMKDLPYDMNSNYEVWLVDEESDYHHSLGLLRVSRSGRANFRYMETDFPLFRFDKLLVTREPTSDADLQPAQHVFSTALPFKTDKIVMKARLDGRQEVPAVRTSARGMGEFVVDTAANTMTYHVEYRRLSSPETMAHIHGFAYPGENAGVLAGLSLGEVKHGVWNYSEADEEKILSGQTYVNVHSENFPAGEIRGQIVVK